MHQATQSRRETRIATEEERPPDATVIQVSVDPPKPLPGSIPTRWRPGEWVGPYQLVTKLATGGMAEIWIARDSGAPGMENAVVIKRMLDAFCSDDQFIQMFLDEARMAAQLSHPHIVGVFDLDQHGGAHYIAMEYLHGENLASIQSAARRSKEKIPLAFSVRWIAQAAAGLHHAHTRTGLDGQPLKLVHRDISPHNLLVTYDGDLKVVDFGIAKAAARATHTVGGQVKGKLSYLAPEQARGEEVDGRCDVFALGLVLFELVTGTRVLDTEDLGRALQFFANGREPLPRASSVNPDVPDDLDDLIAKLLEREVDDRFQSAGEAETALRGWLAAHERVTEWQVASFMGRLFRVRIEQRNRLFLPPARPARAVDDPVLTSGAQHERPTAGETRLTPRGPARRRRYGPVAAVVLAGLGLIFLVGRMGLDRPTPDLVPPPKKLTRGKPPVQRAAPPTPAPAPQPSSDAQPNSVPAAPAREVDPQKPVLANSGIGRATGAAGRPRSTAARPGLERPARKRARPAPEPAPKPADETEPEAQAERPARKPPAPAPASESEPGRLTLLTDPWTEVFWNGRKLGETPLVEVELPAGTHDLELVNPSLKLRQVVRVTVEPGKAIRERLSL